MASEGRRKLIGDQRVVNRGLLAVADAAAEVDACFTETGLLEETADHDVTLRKIAKLRVALDAVFWRKTQA